MFVTKTPISIYAYLLLIIIIGCPFLILIWDYPIVLALELLTADIILLALVWYYCSSRYVSFINGIHLISGKLTSGCANITIVYLLPFLFLIYLEFVFFTILGFFYGRSYTQKKWLNFILHFIKEKPQIDTKLEISQNRVAPVIGVVLLLCLVLICIQFTNNPLKKLQSLTNSISTQLNSEINQTSSQTTTIQMGNVTLPIVAVWGNSGELCTDIQKLIPTKYYPKNTSEINSSCLIAVWKQNGDVEQYGNYPNYTTGYQTNYLVSVMIEDEQTGLKTIDSNIFYGDSLPDSIEVNPGTSSYYAAPPSSNSIISWLKYTVGVIK